MAVVASTPPPSPVVEPYEQYSANHAVQMVTVRSSEPEERALVQQTSFHLRVLVHNAPSLFAVRIVAASVHGEYYTHFMDAELYRMHALRFDLQQTAFDAYPAVLDRLLTECQDPTGSKALVFMKYENLGGETEGTANAAGARQADAKRKVGRLTVVEEGDAHERREVLSLNFLGEGEQ